MQWFDARFMQWFDSFIFELSRMLATAGVPEKYQTLGALGVLYVGAILLVVMLLLIIFGTARRVRKKKLRSIEKAAPAEAEAEIEPETEEVAVAETEAEVEEAVAEAEVETAVAAEVETVVEPEVETEVEAEVETEVEAEVEAEAEPEAEVEVEAEVEPIAAPLSLFERLKRGLAKTQASLIGRIDGLLRGRGVVDDDLIEELEEVLITADLGMQTTQKLIGALEKRRATGSLTTAEQVRPALMEEMAALLQIETAPLDPTSAAPYVIMVIGVNGVGKTTSIGKLANQFSRAGKKVVLGAGDTFRAAAAEQLQIWGERAGVDVIRHSAGADPAAVAFDAAKAAVARKADILILDTAGRLHTKVNLMEELKKVRRVIEREIPGAPHEILLVLDATTGQNALSQAKLFNEAVAIDGIVLTKLDGTAKGGIIVAIASELKVPVRYVGIGERIDDLRPFDAEVFVSALFEG